MSDPNRLSRGRVRRFGRRTVIGLIVAGLWFVAAAGPTGAHEAPEGSEWVMADWMFGTFVLFLGSGVLCFVVAWRRGLLSDVETAKYPMLAIDEPDYYEPEWARDVDGEDPHDAR